MTQHVPGKFWLVMFACLWLAKPAWPNGDLFFEAWEIAGDPEYVVFGNVKDDRGRHLAGAMVTISIDEPFLTYTVETDILGHYRTLDVGRAIRSLGYDVDPARVKVTAEYPGHEVLRRAYRGKYRQAKGAIELNFVMTARNSG